MGAAGSAVAAYPEGSRVEGLAAKVAAEATVPAAAVATGSAVAVGIWVAAAASVEAAGGSDLAAAGASVARVVAMGGRWEAALAAMGGQGRER